MYEAGRAATVNVVVRNPFDVSVELLEIQGPRSSNVAEIRHDASVQTGAPADQVPKKRLLDRLNAFAITDIRVGGITATFPGRTRTINFEAASESEITFVDSLIEYDIVNVTAAPHAKIEVRQPTQALVNSNDNVQRERNPTIVAPHCECVAYFQIMTFGWLFFIPTRQHLNIQIRYRVGGVEKTQVVSAQFEIKPPLLAVVIGSISGAVLGALARILNGSVASEANAIALSIGGAVIMSLIAAVALSRKSASQAFITVEDFFGGFILAALIGYGGVQYFERALIPESAKTVTNPDHGTKLTEMPHGLYDSHSTTIAPPLPPPVSPP